MTEIIDYSVSHPRWTQRQLQELVLPGSFYMNVQACPEFGLVGFLHGEEEVSVYRLEGSQLVPVSSWHLPKGLVWPFVTIRPQPLGMAIATENRFVFLNRDSAQSVGFPDILAKAVFFPSCTQWPVVCYQQAGGGDVCISFLDPTQEARSGTQVLFDFDTQAGYTVALHPKEPIAAIHASLPQYGSRTAFVRFGGAAMEVLEPRIDPPLEASHMSGFSRDGRRLLIVGDSAALVYDWSNGELVGRILGVAGRDSDLSVNCVGSWVGDDVAVSVWNSIFEESTGRSRTENALMVFDSRLQRRLAELSCRMDERTSGEGMSTSEQSGREVYGLLGLSSDILLEFIPDGALLVRVDRNENHNEPNVGQSQSRASPDHAARDG